MVTSKGDDTEGEEFQLDVMVSASGFAKEVR